MDMLERDLHKAKSLLEFYPYYQLFDHVYPFSNENIKELFSYFDFKDKECLSVLASSDQVLDMFLRGAKQITAFDLNSLTLYYFYLKKAFIASGLSYKDFLNFFCYQDYKDGTNKLAFDSKVFEKICINLPENSYKFWTELFSEYEGQHIRRPIAIFSPDEKNIEVLKKTVAYLDKNNYCKLKDIIDDVDIDFIPSDIKALPALLKKTYDIMYFSNIIQYVDSIFKDDINISEEQNQMQKMNKFKYLIEYLSEYLNENSYMLIGYIFLPHVNDKKTSVFNNKIRNEVFNSQEYYNLYIKAMSSILREQKFNIKSIDQDMCIIRKKNKPLYLS